MPEEYRLYEAEDYNDLKDMVFSLYYEDSTGEMITEEKIALTVCESYKHPEKVRIIMIRENNINIGYGIIVFFWSNECGGDIVNIDELYVKKEHRSKGVASRFIEHLAAEYKNAFSLCLETTPANKAALKLYKKLGFRISQNIYLARQINTD